MAAFETLRTTGYARASSRAIGRLAGVNPALVFYYFGSVDDLLVTALAESSAARLDRHRDVVASARSFSELVGTLRTIYRDDVASGHSTVVSELVAASVSHPALAERVNALMEPWNELAEEAVRAIVAGSPLAEVASPRSLARGAVIFYLGANLLTRLAPESDDVGALLDDAARFGEALDALLVSWERDA